MRARFKIIVKTLKYKLDDIGPVVSLDKISFLLLDSFDKCSIKKENNKVNDFPLFKKWH